MTEILDPAHEDMEAAWLHDQESPDEPPQFVVQGIHEVSFMLRRMARLRAQINQIDVEWAEEAGRWQAWRAERQGPLQRDLARLEERAKAHLLALRAADPGTKSISTPYGTVSSTAAHPKWVIDQGRAVAYLEEAAPHLVRTTESKDVLVDPVKAACEVKDGKVILKATGEVVDGITFEPGGDPTAHVTLI